jgi:hypothetical protein
VYIIAIIPKKLPTLASGNSGHVSEMFIIQASKYLMSFQRQLRIFSAILIILKLF